MKPYGEKTVYISIINFVNGAKIENNIKNG
jgi:hypothetical protein